MPLKNCSKTSKACLNLLRAIGDKKFTCEFVTSDFALAEFSEFAREGTIVGKMKLEGQNLVLFQRLKDEYSIETTEEFVDAFASVLTMQVVLGKMGISVTRLEVDLPHIVMYNLIDAVDIPDAVHLAWAVKAKCRYFVTVDSRLLRLLGKRGIKFLGIDVIHPEGLFQRPELRT